MRASDFPYFDHAGPIALAHRGGSLYPPNVGRENTLAAFQAAYDLGYRWFETDVHATKDGVVVAFHDEHLDRVTDRSGLIADLLWEQVREASVGGEPVPRLDELFDAFPDARFNIDLKSNPVVAPACQAILRAGALERVCVGSFSQRRLSQARILMGRHLATAAGGPGVAQLRFAPSWIARWIQTPSPVLQIPRTYELAGRPVTVVTEQLVEHLHRVGKHLHVWTIDDAQEMSDLLDLGVDGLVTDRIDTLREVLVARGQWVDPA